MTVPPAGQSRGAQMVQSHIANTRQMEICREKKRGKLRGETRVQKKGRDIAGKGGARHGQGKEELTNRKEGIGR